jgi:YHS domain-containing protein
MKSLSTILFVFILAIFVFEANGVLNIADKDVEKEKCCEVHKCFSLDKGAFGKDKAKFKAEYKGKTYYFCCEKCKALFEKDPEKLLKCCKEECCKIHKCFSLDIDLCLVNMSGFKKKKTDNHISRREMIQSGSAAVLNWGK